MWKQHPAFHGQVIKNKYETSMYTFKIKVAEKYFWRPQFINYLVCFRKRSWNSRFLKTININYWFPVSRSCVWFTTLAQLPPLDRLCCALYHICSSLLLLLPPAGTATWVCFSHMGKTNRHTDTVIHYLPVDWCVCDMLWHETGHHGGKKWQRRGTDCSFMLCLQGCGSK